MVGVLCRVDEIPEHNGLERRHAAGENAMDIAIFRVNGAIRAYRNVCPHLGRGLSFAPGEFLLGEDSDLICPHHGARFDLLSGECLAGPCRRSYLQAVAVRVEGGNVVLDQA